MVNETNPLVVSFSSLNTYAKCPYHYYLRYIIRESTEEADYTGTVPGNVAHILANNFFKHKEETGEVNYEIFNSLFEETLLKQLKSPNVKLSKTAFASTRQEAYLKIKGWTENLVTMIKELEVEKKKTVSEFRFGSYKNPLKLTDKLYFAGAPDLWFEVEDMEGFGNIVDYKASESTFHLNPKQLFLYAIAVEKALGLKTLMCGFFTFKTIGRSWFRFSEAARDETIMWAENIVDGIKKSNFDAYPSKANCNLCDFKQNCQFSSYKGLSSNNSPLLSIKDLKTKDLDFTFDEIPEL